MSSASLGDARLSFSKAIALHNFHSRLFASFLLFPQHLRFLTGNPFLGGGGSSGVGAKREIRTKGKFRFPKGDADGGAAAPAEYNRLNSTAAI
jgi:hypothetical protein